MSETSGDAVLQRMVGDRGVVPEQFRIMAKHAPRYLELFHETYIHVMEERPHLPRKFKELILVAVDAATYYHYGTKFHMKEALKHGATAAEITEALTVAGVACGIHVPSAAMPLLQQALDEHEAQGRP
jgi:AhpD family alkylhydroperoxidase